MDAYDIATGFLPERKGALQRLVDVVNENGDADVTGLVTLMAEQIHHRRMQGSYMGRNALGWDSCVEDATALVAGVLLDNSFYGNPIESVKRELQIGAWHVWNRRQNGNSNERPWVINTDRDWLAAGSLHNGESIQNPQSDWLVAQKEYVAAELSRYETTIKLSSKSLAA